MSYEPFGKEWRDAVKVMRKDHIIDLLGDVGKKLNTYQEKLKKAEEALQGLFLPMKGPSAFLDAQSKCKETLKEITDLLNS